MARPTKLTEPLQRKLCKAIEDGNYYAAACAKVGLHYATFRLWMEKGTEAKSGVFFEFYEAVTRAEAKAEANMVALWRRHMPKDYRAVRDFLARRHPERWSEKQAVTHSGPDGKAIPHAHSHGLAPELQAYIDGLAAGSLGAAANALEGDLADDDDGDPAQST